MTPIENIKALIEQGSLEGLKALALQIGSAALVAERDSKFSRQALHWAARSNRASIASWLLAQGADKESVDIDKSRPLHVAAMNGAAEAAQILLDAGVQVDAARRDGKTAYMFAQSLATRGAGFGACSKLLARAGANAGAKDAEGKTADEHRQEMDKIAPASARAMPDKIDLGASNPLSSALEVELARLGSNAPDMGAALDAPLPPGPKTATSHEAGPAANTAMPREEALRKLRELGFEPLGARDGAPPMQGREEECDEVASLLDKRKNVMLVGKPGVGKRSMAAQAAERLAARGKVVMALPSSSFRGTKYAGSVNENIQRWLGPALSLGDELVLFINDAHQLSTGKTSSDSADTPLQILREQLDARKDKRLTLLCATSAKERPALDEDEAFMALFSVKEIKPMEAGQALAAMLSPAGQRALLADRPGAEASDAEALCRTAVDLCDKYLFNQAFPGKAFEFAARALAQKAPSEWNTQALGALFCKAYSVPIEIARGRLTADSPYYQLEERLKAKLVGQDGPIGEISEAVSSQIVLANPASHRPVSMLFAGPTGVGKTEAAETMAKALDLPIISLPMGEYKTPYDADAFKTKLSDFISKNYAGVILIDEIEKSDPAVRDVLLNLLDKGVVGSGDDKAQCGFIICVATTNVGSSEMVKIKKKLRSMDGDPKMHDSWIRSRMIEQGFRPEFVNRIGLACDFNDITPKDALAIAKGMFASESQALSASRGLTLSIDESVAKAHAADVFDADYGARGIRRCVDATLQRLMSDRQLALAVGPGSSITARSEQGVIAAVATAADGTRVEAAIRPKDGNRDLARLARAQGILDQFGTVVEMAQTASAEPAAAPRPRPGPRA